MTVGELIAKLGDTEAQVRALRAAVVSSAETAEKALERLERAEEVIKRVKKIIDHWPGASLGYESIQEIIDIYSEHRPS